MRTSIIAIVALLLAGCGAEVLTATAVQGELQAQQLSAMKRQIGNAAGTSGRINVERAIATYQAEKGVYPPSLDALVPNYLPSLPAKADGTPYGYDATTGKLLEAPVAATQAGPTAQDLQLIQQIQAAIGNYGQTTGFYPPTLDDLYPTYLKVVPRTASGEQFLYNNQNGSVTHPRQAQSASSPAAPAPQAAQGNVPMGGAGPMGEVMTGVGMQQQLNSMGQSGANAAGGYAREKLGDAGANRNDQQNQAMDNLGL